MLICKVEFQIFVIRIDATNGQHSVISHILHFVMYMFLKTYSNEVVWLSTE